MEKRANIVDCKDLLMLSLVKFYAQKNNMQRIVPIINGKSPISLRLIDWFITNFSKKHSTIIPFTTGNNVVHFNVYLSYRSQLKAYSKHLFDPFRRRDRIMFVYDKTNSVETTIGQLNLFRFLLQNNLLEYIESHLEEIESDMVSSQRDARRPTPSVGGEKQPTSHKSASPVQTQKKRMELSKNVTKNMNKHSGQRKIQFD